jgi:hypothetical protein
MDSDSWLNCCQGNALIERHWVRVPERFADNSDVATAMSRVWAMSFVTASFDPELSTRPLSPGQWERLSNVAAEYDYWIGSAQENAAIGIGP